MDELNNNLKITYAKNLSSYNFNSTINVPIDANVNIKTILNVESYLFDEKIECINGKAIISGKIGLKVLYVDTDNILNTLSESQNFSETYSNSSITTDCTLVLNSATIQNSILSKDGILKVNCSVNVSLLVYLNLGINNSLNSFDNLISQKSEVKTSHITCSVNTSFDYTTNFETKDNISKVLSNDSYFSPVSVRANDGYAVVEGKLYSTIVYETTENEETCLKELKDIFNIKTDVPISNLTSDSLLDLHFAVDKSKDSITTETDDDSNIITIQNKIKMCGVATKDILVDIVDDAYSTENEVELAYSSREYFKPCCDNELQHILSGELTLSDDETAIEEIISNFNIVPEVTNTYIKDDCIYLEGLIISSLVYLDENKELKQKQTEVPFIINTKQPACNNPYFNVDVNLYDSKTKVKRGTIIELEYSLNITTHCYEKETKEFVNNISLGKPLSFGEYDYQIFLAKPNETFWNLCKRIKISPENLNKQNKNLPLIFTGGERVVIKR